MQFKTWLTAGAVVLALDLPARSAQIQGGKQEQPYAPAPAGFDLRELDRGVGDGLIVGVRDHAGDGAADRLRVSHRVYEENR